MFAFTSDVSTTAATDKTARATNTIVASLFKALRQLPTASSAAVPAAHRETTVPNLAAATSYMAWRS